jgi:hypothetical protein
VSGSIWRGLIYLHSNLLHNCSQSSTAAVDRIHVRTMSGGVPHPLAFQSALELTGESLYGYPIDDSMDPVLQITHNLLALSFEVQETRFLIWDWTTSELLLVCYVLSNCNLFDYSQTV